MDEGAIIAISIISAIIVLVCQAILASEFNNVAKAKGYDEGKYFWFCFLFGVGGMLLVIALPQNTNSTLKDIKTASSEKTKSTAQSSFEMRMKANAVEPKMNEDGKIVCPICGTSQNKTNEMCYSCGAYFKK